MTYKLVRSLSVAGLMIGVSACGIGDDVMGKNSAQTEGQSGYPYPPSNEPAPGPTKTPSGSKNCGFTQGFWKNHADAWPVSQLQLGSRTYDKAQLLAILNKEVDGNGLLALAHQLIAARLNIAYGASPAAIESTLAQADALIGSLVVPPVGNGRLPSSQTSKFNDALTAFNEGKVGPGHCEHGGNPPGGGGSNPPGGSTPYPPGGSTPYPPGGSTPYPPGESTPPADAGAPPPPPPPVIID